MNKRLFNILCIAFTVLSLVCCKKEESDTTSKYFSGYFDIDTPRFLNPGEVMVFTPKDIATLQVQSGDEKLPVSYCVTNSATSKTDTLVNSNGEVVLNKLEITVPEKIGRYKVTLRASTTGYTAAYVECEYDVVMPGWNEGASLTNFEIEEDQEMLIDERDLTSYLVTLVGDTYWMRTNLQWDGSGKPCYEDEASGPVFGRYYTHSEAMAACPDGWCLPSEEDWTALAMNFVNGAEPYCDIPGLAGVLMEDIYFNDIKMWEFWPSVTISNTAHFSAIPTGRASVVEGDYSFYDFGSYAMFWTADRNGDNAGVRYINVKNPDLYYAEVNAEDNAFSVRCIRKVDGE